MKTYDLIIIGGGPAGISAAVYAARYMLNVLVLAKDIGGMAATAHKVCNFPSYESISGLELMEKMHKQAKALNVPITLTSVNSIEKKDDIFLIKTSKEEYKSKTVIFAIGNKRRKLSVKGEDELLGRGVSYCATCDAGFFRNKVVSVVGGRDVALTASLLLAEYAKKVYIIYRKEAFTNAEPSWAELVEKNNKIESLFNEEVVEITGKTKVDGIKLKSGKTLLLDGVFIEIGSEPGLDLIGNLKVKTAKDGYVIANQNQETNVKGFYAAGDVTEGELKQILTAAAQGAIAAFSAYKEIKKRLNLSSQIRKREMFKYKGHI